MDTFSFCVSLPLDFVTHGYCPFEVCRPVTDTAKCSINLFVKGNVKGACVRAAALLVKKP